MENYLGFMPKLREFFTRIGLNDDGFDYIHLNKTPENSCNEVACMAYDETDKTLKVILTDSVTMQVGQEIYYRCLNKTGSTISNGKLVYVSGSQGNRPTIELASTSNYDNAIKCLGMATEDILDNQEGFITTFGLVRGLNTKDIIEGSSIYLSNVAGEYTTTIPVAPLPIIRIGSIMKEHVTDGIIAIRISYYKNEFGDITGGNYSYFETDGTLKMIGNATYWNDLPPNAIIKSRQPASNNPTLATFLGNLQQYTFAVNDYVVDNLEILHGYKEGSNFKFHIHWANNGVDTSDRYVKWEIEYSIGLPNGVFSTPATLSSEILIPANTPSHTKFISDIGNALTGTTFKIGSVIIYNIKRITSSGTAPTANPFGLQVSCHIEHDTLGSRQEHIK